MSPDPGNAGADIANPQTWNGYAYVGNNPLNFTDPSGLGFFSDFGDFLGGMIFNMFNGMTYGLWGALAGGSAPSGFSSLPGIGDLTGCGGPLGNCGGIGRAWTEQSPIGQAVQDPGRFISDLQMMSDSMTIELAFNFGLPWLGERPCRLVAPTGRFTLGPNSRPLFQPAMAFVIGSAIGELNGRGIVPMITSGFRTAADQQRMRNGASGTNPAARVSQHQVGLAVDVNTLTKDFGSIRTTFSGHGLTWGGVFSDPVHFQLAPPGTRPDPAMVKACEAY